MTFLLTLPTTRLVGLIKFESYISVLNLFWFLHTILLDRYASQSAFGIYKKIKNYYQEQYCVIAFLPHLILIIIWFIDN